MAYNHLGTKSSIDESEDQHPLNSRHPDGHINLVPVSRSMSNVPMPDGGRGGRQDMMNYYNDPRFGSRPLEMPMGPGATAGIPPTFDRLGEQPSYHVGNGHMESGQNGSYDGHYKSGDYALEPEMHHDMYPHVKYPRHELSNYSLGQDGSGEFHDNRPILYHGASFDSHGVNGHGRPEFSDVSGPGGEDHGIGARMRRWKTVKEVQLYHGNLVLDCPVPPRLLNQVPHVQPPERDEFTHMRYSAATCDPSEFYAERFTLRQRLFAKPRHTELFIVITMYNEEEELFARTMIGVIKNIEHLNSRNNSKTWGKDAWKKVVLCVVSDGRAKINPRTRAVLAAMGVYQDGIAKQRVNGKDVTAHIYEYTTQMTLEIKRGIVNVKRGSTPVQVIFCLKEKNQKKINSHRWFFQAFGQVLNPNICVLIDAGTKPGRDSIYHLWKTFDLDPMCAGACGEIKVLIDRGKNLINPLVATQNFEYKMSNILDKPFESAFGYISVLPGAFSAYRYVALQNDKRGQGPLEKYFLGERMHGANAGVFIANMYLAEDRILCFELVTKRNCSWILQYVKSSTGETDVPTEMPEFISQRRRWLNGSFFAAVYALAHSLQIFRSSHSFCRKIMLLVEFIYQTISMIFAWFALGNFFLVFRILTHSLGEPGLLGTAGKVLSIVFEWAYLGTLITCFVLSLGNRPAGSRKFFYGCVFFWGAIMAYLMFASVFITVRAIQEDLKDHKFDISQLFKNSLFFTLIVSMLSTYVLYLVASVLFFDPWHMFTSFFQYLLMTPTYINVLNVYAFCNTHDVTWGTKGDDKPEKLPSATTKADGKVDVAIPADDADLNTQYEAELSLFSKKYVPPRNKGAEMERQEDFYKGFRSGVVLVWMFTNLALCAVVLQTGGLQMTVAPDQRDAAATNKTQIYMAVVLWSVAGLSLIRFLGAFWFLIRRILCGV